MLTVKSVLDVVSDIDLVDYLVGVLLQRRGEDNNLIVFGHRFDKRNASRSHEEETLRSVLNKGMKFGFGTYLNIMNQSFIKIKHKAVLLALFNRAQERRVNFGQIGKIIRELHFRVACDRRCLKDCKRVLTGKTSLTIVSTFASIS